MALWPVVLGAMSETTTSKGARPASSASKVSERWNTSSTRELHLGRKGRVRGLEVAGQDRTARPHALGRVQAPGPRGRAQVQDLLARTEHGEAFVQLLELVHGAGRIIFLLGPV